METVWEYFSAKIKDPNALKVLNKILNSEQFDRFNERSLKIFYSVYQKLIPVSERFRISEEFVKEFELTYRVKDHFITRLICRFRNALIDFMINEMTKAYRGKHVYKKKYNDYTLTGSFVKMIYNKEQNTMVTIFEPRLMEMKRRR